MSGTNDDPSARPQLGDYLLGPPLSEGVDTVTYEADQISVRRKVILECVRPTKLDDEGVVEAFLADVRAKAAQALGNKLDSLLRPVVVPPTAPLNISEAELNAILDDVRAQESLVDGLSAAQPLINEIARVAGEIFEDTKLALDAAAAVTQERITADIAPVLEQDHMLRDFQLRATASMGLIARYRHGDAAALDSLVAIVPSLTEVISVEDGVSGAEMAVIEERMVYLLQTISEVRRQLAPDIELFWKQQAELEKLVASFNTALRQARVAVVAWSRAHQRLASGITDPAEIDIFGLAKKAAGTYF